MEGIHPVDGDPAADHVEVRGGLAQRRRAVGGVQDEVAAPPLVGQRPGAEALELLGEECVAGLVGGGEVGHETGQALARRRGDGVGLRGIARAEPAHAGVQLDVHARRAVAQHLAQPRLAPGDDVRTRGERDVELLAGQRAHDQHARLDARLAQLRGLVRARDGQPRRAAVERRPRHRDGAVAVPVGLDHRAQRGAAAQLAGQPLAVVPDGGQVDPGLSPLHGHRLRTRRARRTAPRGRRRA